MARVLFGFLRAGINRQTFYWIGMHRKQAKPGQSKFTLVDLGFGDAGFLKNIASKVKGREKRFLGIERTEQGQKGVVTRQHNLKLVFGGALKKLRKLQANSVGFITMNFLVDALVPRIMRLEKTEIPLVRGQMVKEIMHEAHRVLGQNGRIVITEYKSRLGAVMDAVTGQGFGVLVFGPVPENPKTTTGKSTLKNIEKMREMRAILEKEKTGGGKDDPLLLGLIEEEIERSKAKIDRHMPIRVVCIKK